MALEAAVEWVGAAVAGDCRRGLMLFGPTGTGKTHLACACANVLIESGVLALFLPTVRIPRNDQEAVERFASPSHAPFLVLDDIGAEKPTDRLLECLYTIVEGRLWSGAPVVATTNFDPPGLRARLGDYGERLVGRLAQVCTWHPVGGPDHRTAGMPKAWRDEG